MPSSPTGTHLSDEPKFNDGFPYNFYIDVEIFMDQPVAHGNDIPPCNLRMGDPEFRIDPAGCFSDDR